MFKQIYAESPEQIPHLFAQAWNKRDAYGIANLFVEDAEFVNVVGLWWHDRQAIWKAHDYGLRVIFQHSHVEVRRVKTRYLNDDTALVHSRFKLRGQTAHAGVTNPGTRQNLFSFVVQKEALGWVCISAHNTDIVPGQETNLVDSAGKMQSADYRKK